jgi:hypothetical protein
VSLSTNGWFVDEAVADRLGRVAGLHVHISIDGATAELHDAARGVPGSWRRAVDAIGALLDRNVRVSVTHVVTPLNARWVSELLDHMWLLGVTTLRMTPVIPVGAASRLSGWEVDRRALRRVARIARERLGDDFQPVVQSGTGQTIATREDRAPASLLVRPSGAVLIDSLHPFAFGHVDDGLETCWRRIRRDWRHPDISAWAHGISSSRKLADAAVVPYADEPPVVGGAASPRPDHEGARRPRLPRRSARSVDPAPGPGDLAAAREYVLGAALSRRYQLAALRWSGDADGERVVRVIQSGHVCRLNRTAGVLMDRLAPGSPAEAVSELAARHPEIQPDRIVRDTIRTVRWLAARGVVRSQSSADGDRRRLVAGSQT